MAGFKNSCMNNFQRLLDSNFLCEIAQKTCKSHNYLVQCDYDV